LSKDLENFKFNLQKEADKDLEKLKFDLKRQADKEIETLRGVLQKEALIQQIQFSKLHDRRAEIIELLYSLIAEWRANASVLLGIIQIDLDETIQKDYSDKFLDNSEKLAKFISKNRIFFSDSLYNKLNSLFDPLLSLIMEIVLIKTYDHKADKVDRVIDTLKQNEKIIREEIKELENMIVNDFRIMLGIA